jgi:hypothetical protein
VSTDETALAVYVVVVSTGEAVVVVIEMGEEFIAKLTLNCWLRICGRVPKKLAVLNVRPMSVLGTEVLATSNPGDETVPDRYRILPRLILAAGVTNPMANSLWIVKDTARDTVLQQVSGIVEHTALSSLSV